MTWDTFSQSNLTGCEDSKASLTQEQDNCDFVDGLSSAGHLRFQEWSRLTITIFLKL